MSLLTISAATIRLGGRTLLDHADLSVDPGRRVGLVGRNGAGKSTLLRAISGLVRWEAQTKRGTFGEIALEGEVRFGGERIDTLPAHQIRMRGLVLCPERRRPFRELTVEDNLRAGGYLSAGKGELEQNLERAFQLFSHLKDRRNQIAGTLSGGEQQMLAIARSLMFKAKLLCIDEPSLGLAPKIRQEVFAAIQRVHASGIPVLLIEQEVGKVFAIADRNYVLSQGRIVAEGSGRKLMADETLRAGYLGL